MISLFSALILVRLATNEIMDLKKEPELFVFRMVDDGLFILSLY